VSTVKYELGVYIPDDDVLHSDCREKPQILHSTDTHCVEEDKRDWRHGCKYAVKRSVFCYRHSLSYSRAEPFTISFNKLHNSRNGPITEAAWVRIPLGAWTLCSCCSV
jgi:hypothetical protein